MAVFLTLLSSQSFSQLPGFINRVATSVAGRLVLDPNSDGYTSATTAGFGNNDVVNSELIYKGIKAYSIEPFGDLRRGPSHNFSDFVPDADGNGVYYRMSSGMNIMFRMRMGSIMPGSKGYSMLLDTDGKFGATGPNADPNYQPTTTGTNGNPGFEIEIVLETNFRIAIYNVDGTSNPVLVKQYTNWEEMSQVSVASTNDNGNPDFLIDFYIPFSDLQAAPFNLTTSSPIRVCATTVMAPKAATGGPRSDIYGTGGDTYEDFINGQPACNIFDIAANCPTAMCTAAPTVNSPISTGTVSITGTWTKSALNGASNTATITVYKNGSSVGTVTNVTSGATWTLPGILLINGDIITAKSQATSETMCLLSNTVAASNCNSTNRPVGPIGFCADRKGFAASNYPAGATVIIYKMTTTGQTVVFSEVPSAGGNIKPDGAGGWVVTTGCSGGNGNFDGGSYSALYLLGGCESKRAFACAVNTQGGWSTAASPIPVINNASFIYPSTTTITGTAAIGSFIRILVDDILVATPTLTAGNWTHTFPNPLRVGQVINVRAQIPDNGTTSVYYCTGLATATVICFSNPPIINADGNNQITVGAPITGTSLDPSGTTIRVYTSTNTLVSTTTVQTNGTWSTNNSGSIPATYVALTATSYYANAQKATCGVSVNSGTYDAATATSSARCGTITGPIGSGVASISGTLTGSFTSSIVNLYLDGEIIGTTSTNNTAWGPITVNTIPTNRIYANGVLTIGIQETSKQEVACPASATPILCSPTPSVPLYTLSSGTVNQHQTVTCTISNAVSGSFYALSNSVTGASLGQGAWATTNGNLVLTSSAFSTPGTYNVIVKATTLTGLNVCSALGTTSSVVVNPVVLPLDLIQFKGKKQAASILLDWTTENETQLNIFEIERSNNGFSFSKIGESTATGIGSSRNQYTYLDNNPLAFKNYYRLKMIDRDGKFRYSNTIVFSNSQTQDIVISNVAPNPFTEIIKLNVELKNMTLLQIQMTDFSGRIVYTKTVQGMEGVNSIQCNGLGKLSAGVYMITVKTEDTVMQQKLLKVN